MRWRSLAKALLKRRGYHIHPPTRSCTATKNPFADQQLLLGAGAKTIFDVGANVGQTTAEYRRSFPGASIFSFEPHAESFQQLNSLFRLDPHVHPVCLGLSDVPGQRSLYVNESSATNSLLSSVDATLAKNVSRADVTLTTLDEFRAQRNIETIDILKMDIQGAELLALKGAQRALDEQAICMVYLEAVFSRQYGGQPLFWEVSAFLAKYDFVLFDLYDLKHKRNGQLAWCDAVFLGPRIGREIDAETFY